jgi:hypothetical protein
MNISKKLVFICAISILLLLSAIILALLFWPRIPVIGFYNISETTQSKYVNILQDSIEENFGIIPYKDNISFAKQFEKTKCDILFTYTSELTQALSEENSNCLILPLRHEYCTVFSDSTIPENFLDLINHAKALKKNGNSPLCFAGGNDSTLLDFLSVYTLSRCGPEGVTKLKNLLKSKLDFTEILERSLRENISLKIILNEIIDLKKAQIISPESFSFSNADIEKLAQAKASPIFLTDALTAQNISGFINSKKTTVCDELCAVIIKNRKINKKSASNFVDTVFAPEEKSSSDVLSVKYSAFNELEKLSKTAEKIRNYILEK